MRHLRIACVWILLLPSLIACSQGLGSLFGGVGLPEAIQPKDLPADYRAFNLRTGGGDTASSMLDLMMPSMMLSGMSGSGSSERYELYEYTQAVWTSGATVKTDAGEFLIVYRMGTDPNLMNSRSAMPEGTLRLTLIRKDTLLQITPRPDLTRERMVALFTKPTAPVATPSAKTAAISNMKQLALGMIMYSTDYDDVMPYAQDTKSAFAVMYPYVKSPSLYKSMNPSGGRVLFNMAVAGVEMTAIESPAETVMFFDERPWPDGTRPVAYLDGHVKTVTMDGWREAEKTLHLKFKRKTKPLPANYWKQAAPNVDLGG